MDLHHSRGPSVEGIWWVGRQSACRFLEEARQRLLHEEVDDLLRQSLSENHAAATQLQKRSSYDIDSLLPGRWWWSGTQDRANEPGR